MFITHKKGLKLDGNNPAFHGYGGFNISLTPRFQVEPGVDGDGWSLCAADLRGGGEYGEGLRRQGMKLKKQNVFDDFIAAAQWLMMTSTVDAEARDRWWHNGGLLVGAAITQRPDLFGARCRQWA